MDHSAVVASANLISITRFSCGGSIFAVVLPAPSGATLSTDFEIQNVRVLASGRSLVFSYPHGAHVAVQRPERSCGAQRHRGACLHKTYGRVCDFLGQRGGPHRRGQAGGRHHCRLPTELVMSPQAATVTNVPFLMAPPAPSGPATRAWVATCFVRRCPGLPLAPRASPEATVRVRVDRHPLGVADRKCGVRHAWLARKEPSRRLQSFL